MRVSVAGPGQYVSVVECLSQTGKNRHWCHELSLPFVMNYTLWVYCMVFYVNCVSHQGPHAPQQDDDGYVGDYLPGLFTIRGDARYIRL